MASFFSWSHDLHLNLTEPQGGGESHDENSVYVYVMLPGHNHMLGGMLTATTDTRHGPRVQEQPIFLRICEANKPHTAKARPAHPANC